MRRYIRVILLVMTLASVVAVGAYVWARHQAQKAAVRQAVADGRIFDDIGFAYEWNAAVILGGVYVLLGILAAGVMHLTIRVLGLDEGTRLPNHGQADASQQWLRRTEHWRDDV